MSRIHILRAFVNQRLTVAVEEIIGLFERTITDYEEEIDRQRRLLEDVVKPEIEINTAVLSPDVHQLIVDEEEVPPEQHQWSPSLDQEDPEPPHIKEEQEELWTSQEGEQLQGLEEADITKFPFTPVPVKSEDDEEEPQSSQLHQSQSDEHREASTSTEQIKVEPDGEDCGGPEPSIDLNLASFLQASSDGRFIFSHCFKSDTEDIEDGWEKTREPQSGLDKRTKSVRRTRSHTGERKCSCSICGRTFRHNGILQRHMTCHTGEKPFDCKICGKKFRQKGSLQTHMRQHTGEKPFSCLVCGKRFSQSGTLGSHMRIHTGEKPFSCSVCKNSYSEKGALVRHMRVHTGEKPFSCSVCSKRFSEKGNLNKHMRVHTGEKPFNCSVCGKTFTLLAHLKNHKCAGASSSK